MANKANPIPPGYHSVTPDLWVTGGLEAIEFYQKAFGARERSRMMDPDGRTVMHAELMIGDSTIMLADENPRNEGKSPRSLGGSTVTLHLYVDDVDAVFSRALASGARQVMPLENTFWGDRFGEVADPFGHHWSIATHIQDVAPDEMMERMQAAMAQG